MPDQRSDQRSVQRSDQRSVPTTIGSCSGGFGVKQHPIVTSEINWEYRIKQSVKRPTLIQMRKSSDGDSELRVARALLPRALLLPIYGSWPTRVYLSEVRSRSHVTIKKEQSDCCFHRP